MCPTIVPCFSWSGYRVAKVHPDVFRQKREGYLSWLVNRIAVKSNLDIASLVLMVGKLFFLFFFVSVISIREATCEFKKQQSVLQKIL